MSTPQTDDRSGYVYVLKAHKPFEECYKIGRTKYPKERLTNFGVKLPYKVEVVLMAKVDDCFTTEKELHDLFDRKRLDGEWFNLSEGDVDFIKSHMLVVQADRLICKLVDEIGRHSALLEVNTADRVVDELIRLAKALQNAGKRYNRRNESFGKAATIL